MQFSRTENESFILLRVLRENADTRSKINKNVNFELKFVPKHYIALKITNTH